MEVILKYFFFLYFFLDLINTDISSGKPWIWVKKIWLKSARIRAKVQNKIADVTNAVL